MKVKLTKYQAETIASLAVFSAKPADYVPVLNQVRIKIENNQLTALATNRFAVVKYTTELETPAEDSEFSLSGELLKFLKQNLTKSYKYGVTLELGETNEITATLELGPSFSSVQVAGKFPAIETLLDNWKAATEATALTLKIEFLAALEKIKINGESADKWNFAPGLNVNNPTKPGPVMVSHGDNLTGLIQPNLIKAA